MEMTAMTDQERRKLINSLRGNAQEGKPIYLDKDTGFLGGDGAAEDSRVVNAICSTPTHY